MDRGNNLRIQTEVLAWLKDCKKVQGGTVVVKPAYSFVDITQEMPEVFRQQYGTAVKWLSGY